MFLAFNNGIAATAEEIKIDKSENGKGLFISSVKDFQIVNGGQTTASIYHTLKKDKADISGIFVQVKLSVVKNRDNFGEIVSRISEYANTQNKVSVSDLSSNRPYHIELEKLSRNIFTPHVAGQISQQTKWFYERARGQYKNARVKEGFTKTKQKAFDLKNPKHQMFSKEELAKYINAYSEITDAKKVLIGPHFVVRGNQKNYTQFIASNLEKKIDNVYFEDIIAKAIIFKTVTKLYNANMDLQRSSAYIYVPYSISYLTFKTNSKLDLYKIWRNQTLSDSLKALLNVLLIKIHDHIYNTSVKLNKRPDEWAKREECWIDLKKQDFDIDFKSIKSELEDPKNPSHRKRVTDEETAQVQIQDEIEKIKSIPPSIWHKIEDWGRTTEELSEQKKTVAYNLAGRVRTNSNISDYERQAGIAILDLVIEKAPILLDGIDELNEQQKQQSEQSEITIDLVKKIVHWDKKNKKLKGFEFIFMTELFEEKKSFTDHNKKIASWNLAKVKKYGFKEG